ncbi:hypothetical protein SANTM175S_03650 [Streptomyces antimycoticus]
MLLERIHSGEVPDVLIAVTDDIRQLSAQGTVDGRARLPVARTGIGLAVRARTPRPLIATVDDLVRTLLGARSVAYSRTGASGIYFAQLLGRLGIAEAVNARATIVQKGFAAATLLDGRADLAVQQVSELMTVPGVDVVGPLPADAAHDTEFEHRAVHGCGRVVPRVGVGVLSRLRAGRHVRLTGHSVSRPRSRQRAERPLQEQGQSPLSPCPALHAASPECRRPIVLPHHVSGRGTTRTLMSPSGR